MVAASIGGTGNVSGAETWKPALRSAVVVSAARIAPSASVSVTTATFLPLEPPSNARSCTPHAGFPAFDRVDSDAPVMPKPQGLPNHSEDVATPTKGNRSVEKVVASWVTPTAGTTANASSASRAAAVGVRDRARADVRDGASRDTALSVRPLEASFRTKVCALARRVDRHQSTHLHGPRRDTTLDGRERRRRHRQHRDDGSDPRHHEPVQHRRTL